MKIKHRDVSTTGIYGHKGKDAPSMAGSASAKAFEDVLQDSQHRTVEEKLKQLLATIDEQGDRLAKKVEVPELLKYKKMVSSFLNLAVESMLEFKKDDYFDRRGRHSIYSLVKKVNQRMEDLTRQVLERENDSITILSHIDDIRGMLVDLVL